jgi:hypothetical protein
VRSVAVTAAFLALVTVCAGEEFSLQFQLSIGDDIAAVAPDTFYVSGVTDSNVVSGFDKSDLRKPPGPPGSFVQMYSDETGTDLIRDSRPFDANVPALAFPIKLRAYDANAVGLSGTCYLSLLNPELLTTIPDDSVLLLRRYDANGLALQSYNLLDPNSHSIQWQVSNVSDLFGHLELVIEAKCLAANIDGSGLVTFVDFSMLAAEWGLSGPELAGDINGDNFVGIGDVAILAEKWLLTCSP